MCRRPNKCHTHGDQRRLRSIAMQSSYANGGATNTKVTQPLRLNVVILQGKRENTMHYILDGLGSWRNVYAPVVDIDAARGVVDVQGPDCPVPPWSRTDWKSRAVRLFHFGHA